MILWTNNIQFILLLLILVLYQITSHICMDNLNNTCFNFSKGCSQHKKESKNEPQI